MAERAKGSLLYEVLIVVLAVVLLASILYPSRVWQKEEEQEKICRERMTSIQEFEFRYIGLTNTYSDSLVGVIDSVLSNSKMVAEIDSVIIWDNLVSRDKLQSIVESADLPKEMRQLMIEKLRKGHPLSHLADWDSLNYRLIASFKDILTAPDSLREEALIDTNIQWSVLVGNADIGVIFEETEMPYNVRQRTMRALRRDESIVTAPAWEYMRPQMVSLLNNVIDQAVRSDIWTSDMREEWETARRQMFEADMDTMSQNDRDSLWAEVQGRFWNDQKELFWKKERNELMKRELSSWTEENKATWERIVHQRWNNDQKSSWVADIRGDLDKMLVLMPVVVDSDTVSVIEPKSVSEDSLANLKAMLEQQFEVKKDSLWRGVSDQIMEETYESWLRENKEYVQEIIQGLWESERRVSWEEERFQEWRAEQEKDPEALWSMIKNKLWLENIDRFWVDEEGKLEQKQNALLKLDRAIHWWDILGEKRITKIVDELRLPNAKELWKTISEHQSKGSSLYDLGIVGLYRDQLLDAIYRCPTAKVPYLITVVDTSVIKQLTINCPIVDTTRAKYAVIREQEMQDSVMVEVEKKIPLRLPLMRKIFGGGSIRNHGKIDKSGKKSWDKKTR